MKILRTTQGMETAMSLRDRGSKVDILVNRHPLHLPVPSFALTCILHLPTTVSAPPKPSISSYMLCSSTSEVFQLMRPVSAVSHCPPLFASKDWNLADPWLDRYSEWPTPPPQRRKRFVFCYSTKPSRGLLDSHFPTHCSEIRAQRCLQGSFFETKTWIKAVPTSWTGQHPTVPASILKTSQDLSRPLKTFHHQPPKCSPKPSRWQPSPPSPPHKSPRTPPSPSQSQPATSPPSATTSEEHGPKPKPPPRDQTAPPSPCKASPCSRSKPTR